MNKYIKRILEAESDHQPTFELLSGAKSKAEKIRRIKYTCLSAMTGKPVQEWAEFNY